MLVLICCFRYIDIALSWHEGGKFTSPVAIGIDGTAIVLRLDDVTIGRSEAEGIVEGHALVMREADPVGAVVDGNGMSRGIDGRASQRDVALCADIDLVHLCDI